MTQRAALSAEDRTTLAYAVAAWREAEEMQARVREEVVAAIDRASYREVARVTGFSTNTLQRWKREARDA